jgi:hypothetical protein
LPERWPLGKNDRSAIAEFLAIHVVRTPAYGAFLRHAGKRAREEAIEDIATEHELTKRELAAADEALRSQQSHIRTLLGQISRIGSMFGSLQWALVQFEQDHLITSDQPVVTLPLDLAIVSPALSIPDFGFMNTIEARFTLDPRKALLMTWADAPDIPEVLHGSYAQACSINCACRAQALEHWFCRPQTTPPFLAPPLLAPSTYAIATELIPDYTIESAGQSQRRSATTRLMSELIEENAPRDRLKWVTISADRAG